MIFGSASYLISIVIFAGLAIVVEYRIWREYFHKYRNLLFMLIVISPPMAIAGESVALKLGIWAYYPESIFNLVPFFAVETIVFFIFVMIAVAVPTLVWSNFEDEGKSLRKENIKCIMKLVGK